MKQHRTWVAFVLAAVMLLMLLAGCSNTSDKPNNTSPDPDSSSTVPGDDSNADPVTTGTIEYDTYKIGYNVYIPGAYVFTTLANNSQVVIDAFGNESMSVYDDISVEKIIQDVENLIASGCDGLIVWCPSENVMMTISQMCEKAKVAFVLNDKTPASEEVKEALLANPYFAGVSAPDNASYGSQMAEYALSKGYTTCIINGPAIGNATGEPRIAAFREVFEGAGGTVIDSLRNEGASAATTAVQDCLTAHADEQIDFIYCTGSDFATAAVNVVTGLGKNIPILTHDFEPTVLENISDTGPIYMANGDHYISGTFAAVLLQNYLEGNPLKDADGNAAWINFVPSFEIPGNQLDLYYKFFSDEHCFSNEELLNMSTLRNPDFDYDAFVEIVQNYSLESRLLQKYSEGKVSAEELAAVGISVN